MKDGDAYEMLMYLMENNEDIFALLKEYFNSKDLKPFSNYLHDKFSDIDMTMFMKQIYQEVSDTMKEIIFEN